MPRLMEKVMKDDKYLRKNYQKNVDDWQLLLLHPHFPKDVKAIRSRWELPIPVQDIRDPIEIFLKAYDILFSQRIPRLSYDLLRLISPDMHSYLDSRRIEELIKLQNETDVQDDMPQEVQEMFYDSEGRRKLRDLDWTSPAHVSLVANNIAMVYGARISALLTMDLPLNLKVSDTLTVTREDILAVYLSGAISHFLDVEFLTDINSLVRKTKPGRSWYYPLLYYILTGRDSCEDGLIPVRNIIVRENAEGDFIFEGILKATKRELLETRKHIQGLKGKRSEYSRLYHNQKRDLEILSLSEQKAEDRITARELEKDYEDEYDIAAERYAETLYVDDVIIADKVLGESLPDPKTSKRQRQQVVAKARSRLKKRIEEMYSPSP